MSVLVVYGILALTKILLAKGLEPGAKRELWQAIPGDQIYNLTSSLAYQDQAPNLVTKLTKLEAPLDIGENYGQQITTYFLAPHSGQYYFYLSCDLACQLWISTDRSSDNVVLNMEIKPPGLANYLQWRKSDVALQLDRHHFYFIKVLMKESNGTDFLSVGVDCPEDLTLKPIGAPYLFLDTPEQQLGMFTRASSDVIPTAEAFLGSLLRVHQMTCASYCVRHAKCQSFSYHVTKRTCVLYKQSTKSLLNSDESRFLYVRVQ